MAGLWFEEFTDGMVFNHEWSRTITETDNVWFSLLTMNVQPLHIDAHYAAKSEWGKPLVNSLFTLGLLIGMSVNDTTFSTTLANLGMTDVRFPKPLFQGDSVKVRTTVRSKRESKSRPNEGIVNFFHEMINQNGEVVATCERAALMRKRPDREGVMRSLLFVPGNSAKMMAKAAASGADVIILDLEDAVHPDAKPEARRSLSEALAERTGDGPRAICSRQCARHRLVPGGSGSGDPGAAPTGSCCRNSSARKTSTASVI